MSDSARIDKIRKVHGTQICCPICGNLDGPFDPDFANPVIVWTCPKCGVRFDSDGGTGPFTVACTQCGSENPYSNVVCYFCKKDLDDAKPAEQKSGERYVHCSNCRQRNLLGSDHCSRCGQKIDERGNVIQVRVH